MGNFFLSALGPKIDCLALESYTDMLAHWAGGGGSMSFRHGWKTDILVSNIELPKFWPVFSHNFTVFTQSRTRTTGIINPLNEWNLKFNAEKGKLNLPTWPHCHHPPGTVHQRWRLHDIAVPNGTGVGVLAMQRIKCWWFLYHGWSRQIHKIWK